MLHLRPLAVAFSAWSLLSLSPLAGEQEILPSLDLVEPAGEADFVPGEIIVKLREVPADSASMEDIQEFETVALSDQIRPLRERHEITASSWSTIMVSSCEDEWRRCNPEAVRSSQSLP